ncbi:hypothetical protein NDU88_002830 [Pleurodeles waltl]|uniref:Uncharacterized protein n=1 Tax=Pleurodeles waltl TaxID=8319 RepID=A0AAV7M749_PLEWA|nr:hypothetical protein NDU88_002830 [Pleurodeles waltl]
MKARVHEYLNESVQNDGCAAENKVPFGKHMKTNQHITSPSSILELKKCTSSFLPEEDALSLAEKFRGTMKRGNKELEEVQRMAQDLNQYLLCDMHFVQPEAELEMLMEIQLQFVLTRSKEPIPKDNVGWMDDVRIVEWLEEMVRQTVVRVQSIYKKYYDKRKGTKEKTVKVDDLVKVRKVGKVPKG